MSEYRTIVNDSGWGRYTNRLLVATPTTGLVRIEWVQARYGNLVPVNWSMVTMMSYLDSYMPLRYQVDDAQNLIVKAAIEGNFEWLLLIEHDNVIPEDAFMRLDRYITEATVPVVSGLYFTRGQPSTPLVFRGRGTGAFMDWQMGDLVWCDGVPTGCLLIHMSILRAMWKDAPEYMVRDQKTRKVFRTPRDLWENPENGFFSLTSGTSDLDWCTQVMEGGYFERAGWPEYQTREFPFLVDTNLFCRHIDHDGVQYPPHWMALHMARKPLAEIDLNFLPKGEAETRPADLGVYAAERVTAEERLR